MHIPRSCCYALLLFTLATACASKSSAEPDAGTPPADAATSLADAGPPDAGPQCLRDEDCPRAQVCNLAGVAGICHPGHACSDDQDCDGCAALTDPLNCGHGLHILAYCSAEHGGVCVRARATCEVCENDRQCYKLHPALGITEPAQCLTYEGGTKYCGRPVIQGGCPLGFTIDATSGQCKRMNGCAEQPQICPPKPAANSCPGTDQICGSMTCPGTQVGCVTNDLPGALGLCMGLCAADRDCDPLHPVCNRSNGICVAGCKSGACSGNQVCQFGGFCGAPCDSNTNCEMRFGRGYFCNRRGTGNGPSAYKRGHDENACAPMGCESTDDCSEGEFCDATRSPPACLPGCLKDDDCPSGRSCRATGGPAPQANYSLSECRALAPKTDRAEVGVCCNPGCASRGLDCSGSNEWCCGEAGSPFSDPSGCGQLTKSPVPRPAEAGECFPLQPESPFCKICAVDSDCNSGWAFGFNIDPQRESAPFQEQEFCSNRLCGVTCNPNAPDPGCPTGWPCGPKFVPCFTDDDCGPSLTCEGAVGRTAGRCRCGQNGIASATCPASYPLLSSDAQRPRCVALGAAGALYCVATYQCTPPADHSNFPPGLYRPLMWTSGYRAEGLIG